MATPSCSASPGLAQEVERGIQEEGFHGYWSCGFRFRFFR